MSVDLTPISYAALPEWQTASEPWPIERILQPKPEDRFRLSDRDVAVLRGLLEHRFLTTQQLARLYFVGKYAHIYCNQRLKILFDRGLVLRYRPKLPRGSGSAQHIFAISYLGYQILSTLQPDEAFRELFYREEDNFVQVSRIIHELELNNFCIDLHENLQRIGVGFEWEPTKLTRHTFTINGKTITIEPDAVFNIYTSKGERVLHIEYERSADRRRFRQKIERWKLYRNHQAWRDRYGSEPYILVVGYENGVETNGRKCMVPNSILPLRNIAANRQLSHIAFLTLEERESGGWNCLPQSGITQTLWQHLKLE